MTNENIFEEDKKKQRKIALEQELLELKDEIIVFADLLCFFNGYEYALKFTNKSNLDLPPLVKSSLEHLKRFKNKKLDRKEFLEKRLRQEFV